MQGVSELNTVKNKTTIYSNLILKYFLTHEMVTNKQLADEIGLSEKQFVQRLIQSTIC